MCASAVSTKAEQAPENSVFESSKQAGKASKDSVFESFTEGGKASTESVFESSESTEESSNEHVQDPSPPATMDASKLVIIHSEKAKTSVPPSIENITFGSQFTDYMLNVPWNKKEGWGTPTISPFGNVNIHPASSGLHYGLQIFEGMKAFKASDGKVYLFRPSMNMQRMNDSASRLNLPSFDINEATKLIKKLVSLDSKYVPYSDTPGYSLYIRPYMYSTHAFIGVHAPEAANFSVIMCPAASYFKPGAQKLKIAAITNYARSFPGSAGDSKVGGNYAPSIKPTEEAIEDGYSQILWLHNEGDDYVVTEAGTMNVFFVWMNEQGEKELVTPKVENNLILPGITRVSLMEIAKSFGDIKVVEKTVYMKKDVVKAYEENRMMEVFGAGTAAAVSPINTLAFEGKEYDTEYYTEYGPGGVGPVGSKLKESLFDIQYAKKVHPWAEPVD